MPAGVANCQSEWLRSTLRNERRLGACTWRLSMVGTAVFEECSVDPIRLDYISDRLHPWGRWVVLTTTASNSYINTYIHTIYMPY